jgi:dihydroorotase
MSRILLRGGRVLDPVTNTDKVCDLLLEEGVVCEVGEKLSDEGAEVRDVSGKWVAPGFFDMHVHFR